MRNKFIKTVLTLLVILMIVIVYGAFYEPEYHGGLATGSHIQIFAHRGLGNHAPDNSLVGARQAMVDGFAGVDVDGQMTKDGEIVIYHDLSVNRLTKGNGKVKDLTLTELKNLNLAEKYINPQPNPATDKSWDQAPVSSFEDFVREISPNGTLMVELKVPSSKATGIEEKAISIIKKYNAFDRVYLSSFNPLVLYRLKAIDPRVKTVFIFMDSNWNPELLAEIRPEDRVDLPWFLQQEPIRRIIRKIIKPDALSVNNEVAEGTIDQLLKKGYPIFLWTIDEKERLLWAKEKSPFGIISDEPYLASEVISNPH